MNYTKIFINIQRQSLSFMFFSALTSIKMHNCQFRYQTYLFYNRNGSGFKKYLCTSGGSARKMKCNVTLYEVLRDRGVWVCSSFKIVLNSVSFVLKRDTKNDRFVYAVMAGSLCNVKLRFLWIFLMSFEY